MCASERSSKLGQCAGRTQASPCVLLCTLLLCCPGRMAWLDADSFSACADVFEAGVCEDHLQDLSCLLLAPPCLDDNCCIIAGGRCDRLLFCRLLPAAQDGTACQAEIQHLSEFCFCSMAVCQILNLHKDIPLCVCFPQAMPRLSVPCFANHHHHLHQ